MTTDDDELMPTFYGDGVHDDTPALQALLDGQSVRYGQKIIHYLSQLPREFRAVSGPLRIFPTGTREAVDEEDRQP